MSKIIKPAQTAIDAQNLAMRHRGLRSLRWHLKALVYAILSLSEQQRVANIIALGQPQKLPTGGEVSYILYDRDGLLGESIATVLDLDPHERF